MKSPITKSIDLFRRAQQILPGGVDSPVRAFKAVGGTPLFIQSAAGAHLKDVDGRRYIDYVMSWGPLIHGHAPRGLVRSLARAARNGTSFGAPTALEVELGERVRTLMPSLERVRFVNSGTEAAMSAIRLARAATRRDRIIKFEGCYHGHADQFLVQAGSGLTTLGTPTSPGVTQAAAADTLVATYNDVESCERLCESFPQQIAALIVEPIAGNMGVVPPASGFLASLRKLCDRHGLLLVFDEVISGFRVGAGGAQAWSGVVPDLTCLGKIIGGGLPVGAYGGREDLMRLVSPSGPVYQAGTLSGNPLAMTAGLWSLSQLSDRLYRKLADLGLMLADGLASAARHAGVALQVNAIGSVLTPFFTSMAVRDYGSAVRADTVRYGAFFRAMLARGIYPPPSQFEAWFLSAAHTKRDIEQTIRAAREAMQEVARLG
jgi:glutamate-1-semialdehyde 2,1-aminomutase